MSPCLHQPCASPASRPPVMIYLAYPAERKSGSGPSFAKKVPLPRGSASGSGDSRPKIRETRDKAPRAGMERWNAPRLRNPKALRSYLPRAAQDELYECVLGSRSGGTPPSIRVHVPIFIPRGTPPAGACNLNRKFKKSAAKGLAGPTSDGGIVLPHSTWTTPKRSRATPANARFLWRELPLGR